MNEPKWRAETHAASRRSKQTALSPAIPGDVMKLVIEKIPDLQALYVKELRVLLSAEELIFIKSPLMAEVADDPELIRLFREHVLETGIHVNRLREILERVTGAADPLKCRVVYSLFDEVQDLVEDAAHLPVRDAALVTEAQRIEHYEIACYSALRQFAIALGLGQDAQLLNQTLREEQRASDQLVLMGERIFPSARKAA
jgi:ferritin-like metal-binding protein YciE